MKSKRTIWTSLTGGLSSSAPILLACCKSGACVGVCASPIASLFGISTAGLASSPWFGVLEPVLIAVSAVSFTVSYYSLYVLPKLNCNTGDACACEPNASEKRKSKISKVVFWISLIMSVGVLSYFEYDKYQQNQQVECTSGGCGSQTNESTTNIVIADSSVCSDTSACSSTGCGK